MYYGTYKCRLCGDCFEAEGTSSKDLAFNVTIRTALDIKQSDPISPTKTIIHSCADGSFGMADFLGMKYKKVKGYT